MGQPSDKALVSFNAGELSPLLDSRSDLDKAASGCRVLENMIVESYGAARRRPGTQFIAAARTGEAPDEPGGGPPLPPRLISGGVTALAVQSDGKVLIGALVGAFSGGVWHSELRQSIVTAPFYEELPNFVYRLNTDGTVDETFQAPDFDRGVGWIFIQPSGKILVVNQGLPGPSTVCIMRLNTDGSKDTGYVPATEAYYVTWAAMLSDGRLFVAAMGAYGAGPFGGGGGSGFGEAILLGVNGAANASFVMPVDVTTIKVPFAVSGDKIAINWINTTPEEMSRVNATGTIITSYANVGGEYIGGFFLHPDGRVLMVQGYGGGFGGFMMTFRSYAANGALTSFPQLEHGFGGVGTLPIATGVTQILLNPSGDYIFVGNTMLLKSSQAGVLDAAFGPVFSGDPYQVAINPDGSMWVAGAFTETNGIACSPIVKLSAAGVLEIPYAYFP